MPFRALHVDLKFELRDEAKSTITCRVKYERKEDGKDMVLNGDVCLCMGVHTHMPVRVCVCMHVWVRGCGFVYVCLCSLCVVCEPGSLNLSFLYKNVIFKDLGPN